MPKKPCRNAFYFHMVEFRKNEREKGITYPNMAEVQKAADPSWQTLTPEQKEKYIEMAKKAKIKIPIVDTAKEQELADAAEQKIIQNYIKQKALADGLYEEDFCIIDVNSFCYCNSKSRYLIAECSVVRFNILEGVKDRFHRSINIGKIPIGYGSDVKWSCKEYGLEYPAEDEPPTNLNILLMSLLTFMKGSERPTVYGMPKKIPQIKSFVEQMCLESDRDPSTFNVYKLDALFFYLFNEVNLIDFDNISKIAVANVILLKDSYFYIYDDMSCERHNRPDVENSMPLECTLSRVNRWTFRILERCCVAACIMPRRGQHVPLRTQDFCDLVRRVEEQRKEVLELKGYSLQRTSTHKSDSNSSTNDEWNTLKEYFLRLDVGGTSETSSGKRSVGINTDLSCLENANALEGASTNVTRTEASFKPIKTEERTLDRDSTACDSFFLPPSLRTPQAIRSSQVTSSYDTTESRLNEKVHFLPEGALASYLNRTNCKDERRMPTHAMVTRPRLPSVRMPANDSIPMPLYPSVRMRANVPVRMPANVPVRMPANDSNPRPVYPSVRMRANVPMRMPANDSIPMPVYPSVRMRANVPRSSVNAAIRFPKFNDNQVINPKAALTSPRLAAHVKPVLREKQVEGNGSNQNQDDDDWDD